jgi:hypothetical protein
VVVRRSYSGMNQLNFLVTGEDLQPGHSGNTGARLKSHSTEMSRSEDLMEDLP